MPRPGVPRKRPQPVRRPTPSLNMFTALFLSLAIADPNDFIVPRGQITFDVEGNEGGRWHSRTPHVPSDDSGLTIGRGYDMRYRSAEQITKQMTEAGIPA